MRHLISFQTVLKLKRDVQFICITVVLVSDEKNLIWPDSPPPIEDDEPEYIEKLESSLIVLTTGSSIGDKPVYDVLCNLFVIS